MKNLIWAFGVLIIVIVAIFVFANKQKSDQATTIPSQQGIETPSPNLSNLNLNDTTKQQAKMKVPFDILTLDQISNKKVRIATNKGDIVISLFDDAPIAASNFLYLVNKNFYDGLKFHRREENFVIQGGDPNGDGTGGPGYSFPDEKVTRDYKRGIVAMANAGPDTNGSQFFIMLQDNPLPKQYTIFGQVTEGLDVVDKIVVGDVMKQVSVE